MVKLNKLRQVDAERATRISKQMLDQVLVASGVPHDTKASSKRNLEILDDLLKMRIN